MSKLEINYTDHHRKIFEGVLGYYIEVKATHGTTPSRDYETVIENGPPSGGRNTKLVTPSLSDFLCDIELVAKHSLSERPDLFAQFQAVYIDQIIPPSELSSDDLATITEQVARMLVSKRIYPLSGYFSARQVGSL